MIKRIRSNRGEGFPLTIAIVLSLLIIFCGIIEYFRVVIVVNGVEDRLQDAVIATVTENYADVYHGTREGYTGGYVPSGATFEESISYGDIYGTLSDVLNLSQSGGEYVKLTSEGDKEYYLYDLRVVIDNVPIRTGHSTADTFNIDSYVTLEIPIQFLGEVFPNIKVRIKTSGGYSPIF